MIMKYIFPASVGAVTLISLLSVSYDEAIIIPDLPRIAYGTEAKPHEFPFLALLRRGRHRCAGFIIGKKHIVTAAYCLHSLGKPEDVEVHLGMHRIGDADQLVPVRKMYMHEKFQIGVNLDYDIGLVELRSPINFNRKVKRILIPDFCEKEHESEEYYHGNLTTAGWGRLQNMTVTTVLQKGYMSIVGTLECNRTYAQRFSVKEEHHICATNKVNKTSICRGDQGGPLILGCEVIGISSYGIDCNYSYPSIFTKVCSHLDWLEEKLGTKIRQKKPDYEHAGSCSWN